MLWRKGIPFIFHECNSFVCLFDYINDSLFSCVFFFLHVSVSFNFLLPFCFFGTLLCPRFSSDIENFLVVCSYLRQRKAVWKICTCALGVVDCGLRCSIIWLGLFWENPMVYIFIFSLCRLHSPGKDLLVLSLLTPGGCGPGSWDHVNRRQGSHHSAHRLPLQCPCFHCETLVTWTVSGSPYPLLYQSKDDTSAWWRRSSCIYVELRKTLGSQHFHKQFFTYPLIFNILKTLKTAAM